MTLTIANSAQTSLAIEWYGLTPDWARDKSLADVQRFQISHGNQLLPLGELFHVKGNPEDSLWELAGDFSRVHRIGAEMRSGQIRFHSAAGRHVGYRMRGGEIHVHGEAGDFLGAEMHGGLVHVHGDAGNFVGAAYRGSPRGMTGGTILIDGDCGAEAGAAMRRGLIAIGGNVGDFVGHNLLAGTVLVLGECGLHPGAGLRRGTVALLGSSPALPAGFRFACTSRPTVLPLILHELRIRGFKLGDSLLATSCDIYSGDLLTGGRGEIFTRRAG